MAFFAFETPFKKRGVLSEIERDLERGDLTPARIGETAQRGSLGVDFVPFGRIGVMQIGLYQNAIEPAHLVKGIGKGSRLLFLGEMKFAFNARCYAPRGRRDNFCRGFRKREKREIGRA